MDYTDDLELALPIQGYTNWHSPVNSNFTTIDTKLGKAYQNVWNEGDVTYITNNAKYVTDHWERWNNSKAASLVKIENTGVVTNYFCNAGIGTIVWIEDIFGDGSDGAVTLSSDTDMGGIYNYTTFDDGGNTITTTDSCLIIRATTSITISGEIDASGKGGDGGSYAYIVYSETYGSYINTYQSSGLKGILDLNSTFISNLSKDNINSNNIENFVGMIGGSGGNGGNAIARVGCTVYGGNGGNGGGIVILIAPTITITGTIDVSGNNGGGGATQYKTVAYGGNGGDGGLIILGYSSISDASANYNYSGGIGGSVSGDGVNIAGSIGSDGIIKKIEV